MPICFAEFNRDLVIKGITGNDKVKAHLQNLGFIVGETVRVINALDENVIVKIKGVSLAISHELSRRVLV